MSGILTPDVESGVQFYDIDNTVGEEHARTIGTDTFHMHLRLY